MLLGARRGYTPEPVETKTTQRWRHDRPPHTKRLRCVLPPIMRGQVAGWCYRAVPPARLFLRLVCELRWGIIGKQASDR